MINRPSTEERLNQVNIAAKRLKLAVERAARVVHSNPIGAEKLLMQALKRAEEDGL